MERGMPEVSCEKLELLFKVSFGFVREFSVGTGKRFSKPDFHRVLKNAIALFADLKEGEILPAFTARSPSKIASFSLNEVAETPLLIEDRGIFKMRYSLVLVTTS